MDNRLGNKVAVVTGGSAGIGLGAAKAATSTASNFSQVEGYRSTK